VVSAAEEREREREREREGREREREMAATWIHIRPFERINRKRLLLLLLQTH
jgi:hypothetical protein